jgi:hypothetical protein
VTRTGSDSYDTETLDEVMFVPLIGEQGWDADAVRDRRPPRSERKRRPAARRALPQLIGEAARALPEPEDDAFADAFERFGDQRIVLLGEASHGTSEFYRARGNHAPADRAPWLRHRRGRGRLARRLGDRSLRPAPAHA